MKNEIETLIEEFGEENRKIIEAAINWLDSEELSWTLDHPINKRRYIEVILEKKMKKEG